MVGGGASGGNVDDARGLARSSDCREPGPTGETATGAAAAAYGCTGEAVPWTHCRERPERGEGLA